MRFSIWSLMPSPCRPPIALASSTRATGSSRTPLIATGRPRSNCTRDVLRRDRHRLVPVRDAHDRLDDLDGGVQVLEPLGLVGGAPDVGVGGVRLLGRGAVGQVAGQQPFAHLGPAAQLGHELPVQPGLVDAQPGVGQQAVAVEPLDVVALVGRPVAPDVDLVVGHGADQQGAGDGPAERGGVEVGQPRRADVERAAGQRDEPLLDQRGAAVDGAGDLGAVLDRPVRDAGQVGFVVLAEVGGVRARHGAVLAHPGHGHRGVETARERDADLLPLGQRLKNFGHEVGAYLCGSGRTVGG